MACRTSFLSRQRDVIASFSLSKPIRPLVNWKRGRWEGLVCPPPFFTDLLWGRGREGWVQSHKKYISRRKYVRIFFFFFCCCCLTIYAIYTNMYTYLQMYRSPLSPRLLVDLLGSHNRAKMVELWVSPSHILQIELSEGVMRFPVAGW